MNQLIDVPLAKIRSRELLRQLDRETIDNLSKSISTLGLLQPILVRPNGDGFEIIFGYHRAEACRQLHWNSMPAFVQEMSDDESFVAQIVENLQRNNEIDTLVEAKGYISLIDRGWTINSIAKRIGKSDSYVSDRVGLIRRLHPAIVHRLANKEKTFLKPSHCELIARVTSSKYQLQLAELVERKRLSVRELGRLISKQNPMMEKVQSDSTSLFLRIPEAISILMGVSKDSTVVMHLRSRKTLTIEVLEEPVIAEFAPSSL